MRASDNECVNLRALVGVELRAGEHVILDERKSLARARGAAEQSVFARRLVKSFLVIVGLVSVACDPVGDFDH